MNRTLSMQEATQEALRERVEGSLILIRTLRQRIAALLVELIEEARQGSFHYDRMSEALAAATREQSAVIKGDLERAGH